MGEIKKFAILIATKNRRSDLETTLEHISGLLSRRDTRCIVCDDGSTDGTSEFVAQNYPAVTLIRHEQSKGYLYSRNKLLNMANSIYAISLDDDAHLLSDNPLENVEQVFGANPKCGAIAFRLYWSKTAPEHLSTSDVQLQVQSFVGCGHAWRMSAWQQIPDYPEWFQFYGEEDFASMQLFNKGFQVVYEPKILVQHRVDLNQRKSNPDYIRRLRRSLASGWYLYLLFAPWRMVPRKIGASIASQLRTKILKGNFQALAAVLLAMWDVLVSIPHLKASRNRMAPEQYLQFKNMPEARIYWQPDNYERN